MPRSRRTRPVTLAADGAPQPGDKLYSGGLGDQSSGMIVNVAASPDGGHDLLAVAQTTSIEAHDLRWKSPGGAVLQLLELPYPV